MDSGNSDSLQSSSGDEEYDSRPATAAAAAYSISALMNSKNKRIRTIHDSIQPVNPSQVNVPNFEPLSNYFDSVSRQPPPPPRQGSHHPPQNSLLNLDMMASSWSKALRSDLTSPVENLQHHHHHNDPAAVISSSHTFSDSYATTTTVNPPAGTENINTGGGATNTPRDVSDQSNDPNVVRNPKKRSRASRRAPTTVLTTDTTNFRAMVQEFTGIPAPPFTSSSPFSRTSTRFDLFGTTTPSNSRSNIPLDSSQTPSYLRRPFPQKVQLPPPVPPPSFPFISSSSPFSTSMVDLDHTNKINNLPNHPLFFSSVLQQKFPPSSLKVGGMNNILDQFGQFNNTGSLSELPGLISSDQTTTTTTGSRNNNDNTDPMNWEGNGNGNLNISSMNAPATNGKLNFSGNPSNFPVEKGSITDNVAVAAVGGASRGEGMMESWVCSSD